MGSLTVLRALGEKFLGRVFGHLGILFTVIHVSLDAFLSKNLSTTVILARESFVMSFKTYCVERHELRHSH